MGLKETGTGDISLCDEKEPAIVLESMEFPDPVIQVAIEPKTKAGQDKMALALLKPGGSEDPTFKTLHRSGDGPDHHLPAWASCTWRFIVDRLMRELPAWSAVVGKPQVAYRETLAKTVQAGGPLTCVRRAATASTATALSELSPLEPGGGFVFEDRIGGRRDSEGIHSRSWSRGHPRMRRAAGVLGGLRSGGFQGCAAGWTVPTTMWTPPKWRYKIAGSMALKDALAKAD